MTGFSMETYEDTIYTCKTFKKILNSYETSCNLNGSEHLRPGLYNW